jgi:tetratricopeptide (TPR) repeat protein
MRAAGYFREDDRFEGTPDKFTELIKASEGKVPAIVLVSALRLCTREIKGAITSQETTGKDGKTWRLGGGQELISQLLVIAERDDPQSLNELRELSVELHNLERNQPSSGSAQDEFLRITASETKPEEPVEVKGEIADARQALEAVRASAVKDPAMALARAEAIQVHEYQSQALATVTKHLSALEKAVPVLEEAERAALEADSAPGPSPGELANTMAGKVDALAEIAEAWAHWGESDRASAMLDKALALALDLIQEQAALRPGMPSGFESSTALLRRVAQAEATLDPLQAAQRAQRISDPRLRAFFLISMATELLQKT